MSNEEIVYKIEQILSDILSDKYDCKITIKFGDDSNGNANKTSTISEKQILHKQA